MDLLKILNLLGIILKKLEIYIYKRLIRIKVTLLSKFSFYNSNLIERLKTNPV